MKVPKAPPGLQRHGRSFWHRAAAEREFSEVHDLKRLEMECRVVDEIQMDEATLKLEGRYTRDRWGRRVPHPALKSLQENRALFLRIIRELGLDLVVPDASRPPRQY